MEKNRWRLVRKLFHEVVEVPTEERDEILAASGAAEEVQAQVRRLLDHHEDPAPLLHGPLADLSPRNLAPPNRVGPWEILETLGQGGMGAVYLGQRADGVYRGRAAVKLLHADLAAGELVERFRRERQILADLEHPDIARLIDGGTTGDGRPYLVMEYVRGEPLDAYCDRRALDLGERLALFRQVATAVHFAHQNLVVHRDLKPGNILVAEDGRPKLLDFGIAKLLAPYQVELTTPPTATAAAPLTPEFASPEQLRGQAVTTGCDIYSLGALLYLLLTGNRPFRLADLSAEAFVQAVCYQDPQAASERVAELHRREPERCLEISRARSTDPRRLERNLSGDLDKILAKALRKEPRTRYLSAEEMARDVDRFLDGRPVRAREPTLPYRTGKFLRRYRWPVAVAALALTALTTLTVGLLVQRTRILRERARGEEVTRFLEGLFEVSAPDRARGSEITARELLDRGTLDIRQRLEGQPSLQGRLLATMGRVYRQLGLYDEARPLLEEARRLHSQVYPEDHPEVARGLVDSGDLAIDLGEFETADRRFRESLAMVRRLGGDLPQIEVAALSGRSRAQRLLGNYDPAEELRGEALELATGELGPDHEWVAVNQTYLGQLLRERGAFPAAETAYRQALKLYRRQFGEQHPQVANLHGSLGLLYDEQGDYEKADESLRTALEIQTAVYPPQHPEIARTLKNLAALLDHRGLFPEAEEKARLALEARQQVYGEEHPTVADALNLLGMIHYHRGDLEGAGTLLQRALSMWSRLQGEDFLMVAAARTNLAQVLEARGELEEAVAELDEALGLYRTAFGERHLQIATVNNNRAVLMRKLGRLEEARRGYEVSLEITRELLGREHPNSATLSHNLAVLLEELGQLEAAEGRFREALAAFSEILPAGHLNLGIMRKNLASVLIARRQMEEAEGLLEGAFECFRHNEVPPEHQVVLSARGLLGEIHIARGRHGEAEEVLIDALERAREHHGDDSPPATRAAERMILLYESWGRPELAGRYLSE